MGYRSHKGFPASRLKALESMDPDQKVRVYTRQDPLAVEEARIRGYFTGSHGHRVDGDDFFDYPYEWMRQQMEKRIPNFSGDLPVWAWLKKQNERKWIESWVPKERKVLPPTPRIIALIPRKRILISCFELWHNHLNNWPVLYTEEEDQAFEKKWPLNIGVNVNPEYQREVEANWEEVFNITGTRSPFLVENHGKVSVVQACVDRVYLDEVVSIRWEN